MPRFFRRFAEGVFDFAVVYSNGANIAASLLFSEPDLLSGAALFRPMIPFVPDPRPDLRRVSTLLAAGQRDPIVSPEETSALAKILEGAGARVSMHWHEGRHELAQGDLVAAQQWMEQWRLPT